MSDETDRTPHYQPPGIPNITPGDEKGMVRLINKMLKPKFKLPKGRGVQADQSVHVKHKGKESKVKYY
jgi:hypothetical protein